VPWVDPSIRMDAPGIPPFESLIFPEIRKLCFCAFAEKAKHRTIIKLPILLHFDSNWLKNDFMFVSLFRVKKINTAKKLN
jgi:hypothetical protein